MTRYWLMKSLTFQIDVENSSVIIGCKHKYGKCIETRKSRIMTWWRSIWEVFGNSKPASR